MKSLVVALLLFLGLTQVSKAQTLALTGGTIIDGNGGTPISDGVVVIRDKRIIAVGPKSSVSIPADARQINVSGKYVLPGLMDANVHLVPWPSWTYIEFLARYENNFQGIIEEAAQIALKHGFTTVFDSMGPLRPLMAVRDKINEGEIIGSRVFVAGDIVGFRAVFTTPEAMESATPAFQARINALFELNVGQDLPWKSPEQIAEEMRKYLALGPDFVKVGVTGDGQPVNSSTGEGDVLRFSPAQLRAMVKTVHAAGKIIQTHTTSAEALRIAVESGFDMGQHCSMGGLSRVPDSTIKLILAKRPTYYCGTQWRPLTAAEQRQVRDNDLPDSDAGNGTVNYDLDNQVRMIKAGVPMLVSTDAGTIDPDVAKDPRGHWGGLGGRASLIGEAEFTDMEAERQRGMTPMAIVQSATKNIAAAYHKLDQFGTLEAGKYADIIVVDADPLEDIENIRKISMVIKEGQIIDTAALPLHPILTSPEAENPGPVRMK